METFKTKRCGRCQQPLPITHFWKNRHQPDGYAWACKVCFRTPEEARLHEANIRDRNRNRKRISIPLKKRCPKCQKTLAARFFKKNRTRTSGLATYCNACMKTLGGPGNNQHQQREASHRRRARKRTATIGAGITRANIQLALHIQNNRCAYCKKPFTKKKRQPTIDHIDALSQGGIHSAQNFVLACRACNSRKGTRKPPIPVQRLLGL
jgi:5-methylcytosine-specific restriction endonuclease McrA